MKIGIFGADGRTGQDIVKYVLAQGHDVVAGVYRDGAQAVLPQNIEVVVGDVMSQEVADTLVQKSDVIISALGHIPGGDPLMQTKGMQNIIASMETFGVKRIISLTGTGVRIEGDRPSVIDRIANFAVEFADPHRVRDGREHAKVLQGSKLDWTIVRVLKLSQSDWKGGDYALTEHGPAELLTPRQKVAKIMVDLATSQNFIHKMPIVSK